MKLNSKNAEIHKALPFGEGWEGLSLVNEEKEPGVYEVEFSKTDLASGIYIYRIQVAGFVETKKMVLLR